jgi:DNA-binding NarL/FixJ family response regulator
MNGLEATRRIKSAHPDIAILILTVHDDAEYIFGILEAGAAGYIIKSEFDEQILQAIRGVAAGETVLSAPITRQLLRYVMKHRIRQPVLEKVEQLNVRETEILRLAARGQSNKDISEQLGLSVHTVKGNLMDIFAKLEAASRTEAVMKGLLAGYINLDDVG